MASAKQLTALKKLREFFHSEIDAEVRSGFARLVRMPESHVVNKLDYDRRDDALKNGVTGWEILRNYGQKKQFTSHKCLE
jgi:hypothetical protein